MTGYMSILRLRLRYRVAGLRPQNLQTQLESKRFQTIALFAAYVILVVSLIGTVILLESQLLGAMITMNMPDMLLALAILMGMMMTVAFGFFYIISSLYMGKDASFLASLPVSSRTVFSAKLTEIWLGETGIMALTFVPACVLYGMRMSPDALFYVRALVVLLLSPVIPMLLVTLLSTVLMRLSSLLRHRDAIVMAGSLLMIGAAVYFQMQMTNIIPEDASQEYVIQLLENNKELLNMATSAFPPAQWAARALVGEWRMLALLLAAVAGCTVLIVFVLGGAYQKLSLLQGETYAENRKVRKGDKAYAERKPLSALYWREWREILRSPSYAINSLGSIAMPIIFAIIFSSNAMRTGDMAEFGGMLTSLREQVPDVLLTGGLAAIFCLCGGMNPAVATAVSREGKRHMLIRMLPVAPRVHLTAKLAQGFVISAVSCAFCCGLISALIPSVLPQALAALLISLPVCFVICALSLIVDVARPRFNWNTETEAIKQNTNVLFGMLISLAVLVLLAGVSYLCYALALPDALLAALYVALPVALSIVCWKLLTGKVSALYGEIEG